MKKGLIISLIVIVVVATLGLLLFTNRKFLFGIVKHNVSNNLVLNKEYDIKFDEINIDSEAADIEIKENLDSKIKVVIYGDEERTKVDTENKKLSIKTTQKNCNFWCFNVKIAKIEIYLPKDYSKNINIVNNLGDIKISSFSRVNLDVKANAGDIIVDEINSIKANVDLGDIEINKINEYLDIKNACGDVKIDSINLEKNSKIKSNLGDIKIGSTNEIYIEAKTNLGDTKINNNYRKSDIVLKINNDCGDIKVNN